MTSDTFALINHYTSKGILVDTNILLLYFVGGIRRSRISRFSRTNQFNTKDYDLLIALLSDSRTVATTPNILTEVSSFIDKLGEPDRASCYLYFAQEVPLLQESYIPSRDVASTAWTFPKYGLTDCSMVETARRNEYLVLTDDLKVANFLCLQNVDTINFNDLRSLTIS